MGMEGVGKKALLKEWGADLSVHMQTKEGENLKERDRLKWENICEYSQKLIHDGQVNIVLDYFILPLFEFLQYFLTAIWL